jgi:hypothetical protein
LLYVIDTRTKLMQILQLYYAFSSRGKGGNWEAGGTQSVGSFFGFQWGRACAIRATSAEIRLTDLTLSDLGPARGLGSFGCGVFIQGGLGERVSFAALVLSEMA